MPAENWEILFEESLFERAYTVAAELKDVDPDAQARARSFRDQLEHGLACPECWVRYGQTVTLHQKRWLMSCGEHDYKVPPPNP